MRNPVTLTTILPARRTLPHGQQRAGRTARVSRLMALAIRCEGLLREGVVRDYAELARLGCVSRPQVTQLMNLLNLASDIQERLLFLPPVRSGRDPLTEHHLRHIAACTEWVRQRELFCALTERLGIAEALELNRRSER